VPPINRSISAKQLPRSRERRRAIWRLLEDALPALAAGRLKIMLPNGRTIERRGAADGPEAVMTLHRWRAVRRILLGGENGLTDSYMDGDWSTPDLPRLLQLCMRNEAQLIAAAHTSPAGVAVARFLHLLRSNTRRGSQRNIAAHYDLGNDFFAAWLDADMNYSSALYAAEDTLEQAQERKLDRIAGLLALAGGERVLEIGCGWGSLAERLIRRHSASVVGVTLSGAQFDYARARLAGEAKADLRLLDYRDVSGSFDRIVSVEMIEAVGESYWPVYFPKLRACLKRGGIAVVQAITIDESRFSAYRQRPDFIQRHIFPGGMLPTKAIIGREAARAGLRVESHEGFGDSYAVTLREWRSRFLQNWPSIKLMGFDERFRRMWDYYLVYCETGFRMRAVDVGLFKFIG